VEGSQLGCANAGAKPSTVSIDAAAMPKIAKTLAMFASLSADAYSSAFVLNRRINVESVMFRLLFLIERLRFFSGPFV
jgi:hypothetical protein